MSCGNCSTKKGTPGGCKSNGSCSTGTCNRLNTFDWLSFREISDPSAFLMHEVSFKNGASKSFYINSDHLDVHTGHWVVVDTGNGKDVGIVTLSGELARLQMKRKKVSESKIESKIVRLASERDLEKMREARKLEKPAIVKARAIIRSIGVDMKLGDVQYQADIRKATFYYTAEGRVDFRELVKRFAGEFRVKIEMRQIGARQESSRIGGIGSCGRELCCSTWLSDFKSVSTSAARYQNLAINQSKLSGQCGRLKCCLNYELDTYMNALKEFPKKVDKIQLEDGHAELIKMDIFKGIMYYAMIVKGRRGLVVPVDKEDVKKIKAMNEEGKKPTSLLSMAIQEEAPEVDETELEFDDLTGVIELPEEKKKRRNNRNRNRNKKKKTTNPNAKNPNQQNKGQGKPNPNQKNKQKPQDKQNPNQQKSKNKNPNQQSNSENKSPQDKSGNRPNKRRPNPNQNRNKQNPNQNNPNKNKESRENKPKEGNQSNNESKKDS